MRFISALLLLVIFFLPCAHAQDTLPLFSVIAKSNGKVIISWHNNYPVVTQISIQRSYDSLKGFTTLLTVPDPTIPENGFVDSKLPVPGMFYRLFILLENGRYIYTKTKKALSESEQAAIIPAAEDKTLSRTDNERILYLHDNSAKEKPGVSGPAKINDATKLEVEKIIFVKLKDSLVGFFPLKRMPHFRDSVLNKTRDTLFFVSTDTILIKPFVPKEVYKISAYIFTAKDGNVNIVLPESATKKYNIRFLEQDNSPLLEIKEVKDALLILDKTNFVHSGWFRFELYEDGKLKEKNKLFIPKDF